MSTYGNVAVEAVRNLQKWNGDPVITWEAAAKSAFPRSLSMQRKSCPRLAFFGLIAANLIDGIPAKEVVVRANSRNARYAVRAVEILRRTTRSLPDAQALWQKVIGRETKVHNGQMHVVLALWQTGQIRGSQR